MKFASIMACMLIYSTALAQTLKISPEKPSVTDSILIEYTPAFFGNATAIECRAYFSGIGGENDFPRVTVIPLTREGSILKGLIMIPVHANGLVITFSDSLGKRDNNNQKGYWSLLYDHENPVPGSWAGVGDLLYGVWITENCMFHLKENPDSVQAFFKRDLTHHPEVKHAYMRQYLASFKTGTAETDREFRNELEYLSTLPALSESNLLTLKSAYARLKDTLNANRLEREIFIRFPNGFWAPQVKSLPLDMKAGISRDFNVQAKAYQEFKKSFLKSYDHKFGTHTMNIRAARMLSYMVNHFSEQGTIELWKNEVNLLTDVGKINAYQRGAQQLLEKNEDRNKTPSLQLENKLYQFNLTSEQKVKDAESLAMLAIELWYTNADGPLQQNESLSMTKDEIIQHRNSELSEIKVLLGASLLQQNRIPEAVTMLKESVINNNYTKPETNELYIQALIKSGDLKLALSETRKIIALNKSTHVLDQFYIDATKKQHDLELLKQENLEKVKSLMTQKLTLEKCPDFTSVDLSGKSISSKSLKDKIVVITFWASWCPPCMIELKSIDAVVKKYENDSEVVFLSVNEDEIREDAMRIINQYTSRKHFMFDQKRKMIYAFGTNGLPAQVIIDRNGDIRFRISGLSNFNERENTIALEAMIEV